MQISPLAINFAVAQFRSVLNRFEIVISADLLTDSITDHAGTNRQLQDEITSALYVRLVDCFNYFVAQIVNQILDSYERQSAENRQVIDEVLQTTKESPKKPITIPEMIKAIYSQNKKLWAVAEGLGLTNEPEIIEVVKLRNDLVHNADVLREPVVHMIEAFQDQGINSSIAAVKPGDKIVIDKWVFKFAWGWMQGYSAEVDDWIVERWNIAREIVTPKDATRITINNALRNESTGH